MRVLVLLLVLAAASVARAESPVPPEEPSPARFYVFVGYEGVALAGGLVSLAGTTLTLDGQPPPVGWRVASFVAGGADLVAGVLWLAADLNVDDHFDQPAFWAFGGVMAGLGAANLAAAFVAGSRARAAVAPLALRDARGALVPGLALRVAPF